MFGTIGDQTWNQIWDCLIQTPDLRSAVIKPKAERILDAYYTGVRVDSGNDWSVVGVRWVDLHSADGETGDITGTPAHSYPAVGSSSSQALPGNVAALITKNTLGGRATRNGRSFHPGVLLADLDLTNPNKLVSGGVTGLNTAYQAVFDALNFNEGGTACDPVVVSRDKFDVVRVNLVTSIQCQTRLATQRRRLRD